MTFGPARCACCGSAKGVEAYSGCPDDLTVWLCFGCHGRAHEMRRRVDIGHLTTAALARKKAQARCGQPTNLAEARAMAGESNRKLASAFAGNVIPVVRQIQATGATSYRAIAAALNARGVKTARGGEWQNTTVRNMMLRKLGR